MVNDSLGYCEKRRPTPVLLTAVHIPSPTPSGDVDTISLIVDEDDLTPFL